MFVTCKSLHVTVPLCVILGLTAVTEVKYSERTACSGRVRGRRDWYSEQEQHINPEQDQRNTPRQEGPWPFTPCQP